MMLKIHAHSAQGVNWKILNLCRCLGERDKNEFNTKVVWNNIVRRMSMNFNYNMSGSKHTNLHETERMPLATHFHRSENLKFCEN